MTATRRVATAVLATALLTLGLMTVDGQQADALCGNGTPNGYAVETSWGRERTLGAHCTTWPDAYYSGEINDRVTDGSCVWVEYWEGGMATWIQQWECTTGGWSSYGWWDQNGDATALARLCRNQGCTLYLWNEHY